MNATEQPQAVEREAAVPGGEPPQFDQFRALSPAEQAYEIANQLCGYVDVITPKREADFMLKIGHWAGYLGDILATPAQRPPQPGVVTEELRVRLAGSLAQMVVEYVEGGIRSNQDWRTGLAHIVEARIQRLAAAPSPGASVTASPADGDVIDALRDIDGCFEAAYVEGLADRLAEADKDVGSLADLVTRRLLPAREVVCAALSRLEASQPASSGSEAKPVWQDGIPPKPWSGEWFIAETTFGDRVVLRSLPEEYTYDFQTADETYIKADRIKRWMQFPDSAYLFPGEAPPSPAAETAPDAGLVEALKLCVYALSNMSDRLPRDAAALIAARAALSRAGERP
jgi:hypothetical protein